MDLRDKLDYIHEDPDYQPPENPRVYASHREVHDPFENQPINYHVTVQNNDRQRPEQSSKPVYDYTNYGVAHKAAAARKRYIDSFTKQSYDYAGEPNWSYHSPRDYGQDRRAVPDSQKSSRRKKRGTNKPVNPHLYMTPEEFDDENERAYKDLNDIDCRSPYVEASLQSYGYNPSKRNRRYY